MPSKIHDDMFAVKLAGLSVLALGLASRQAMSVDVGNCVDLYNSMGFSETLTLTTDIFCSGVSITIASGEEVTVMGGGYSIEIDTDFIGESLFENHGTLTLNNVVVSETAAREDSSGLTTGVRAINNRGTLTAIECTFQGLNLNGGSNLQKGGAVSDSSSSNFYYSERTSEACD